MSEEQKIRVVIADDQKLVRAGFAMVISSQPDMAVVGQARDGAEAVALAETLHPDVVLMDVMMPVMDGMEATQRIRGLKREDAASIPIIAMTAQTTADIRETCRKAGMDDYIAKPIREEELAKVIRKSWKAKKV